MATHRVIAALLFVLAFGSVELSSSFVLKGSVTCLDCKSVHDLSGIKILVKCNQVKKLAMATTQKHGAFETELPSDARTTSAASVNCQASILGSSEQLYTSKKNMISSIVKAKQSSDSFTISKPLKFYTKCPLSNKDGGKYCVATNSNLGSSKTVDLPLPRELGFPPTSYYVPFVPIIGIP